VEGGSFLNRQTRKRVDQGSSCRGTALTTAGMRRGFGWHGGRMLPVQLGGLKGCVGRIRQVRDDGDWSQDTASAGESRPDSSDSSEWSNPD